MNKWILVLVACISSCATTDKVPSLRYNHAETTEEPRLQKVVSRFCDSAYIALNQTYEQSSTRILEIYDTFKSLLPDMNAGDWSELTIVQIISAQPFDQVVNTLSELKKELPEVTSVYLLIELTKVVIVTETSTDHAVTLFNQFHKTAKLSPESSITLTKAALFSEFDDKKVLKIFEDLKIRLDQDADELTLASLTSSVLISGQSTHELVKNYDSALKLIKDKDSSKTAAELVKMSIALRVSPSSVARSYQKVIGLQKPTPLKNHSMELLKISLLSKEPFEKTLKSFNRVHKKDTPASMAFVLLIGESLEASLVDQSESDECHGAYTRFVLSFDRFRLD